MTVRRTVIADAVQRIEAAVTPAQVLRTGEPPVELRSDGVVLVSEDPVEPEPRIGNESFEHRYRLEISLLSPRSDDAAAEAQLDGMLDAIHDAMPVGTALAGGGSVIAWEPATYRRERLDGGDSVGVLTAAVELFWVSTRAVG